MLKDNHTFTQLAIALVGVWPVQTICCMLEDVDEAKLNMSLMQL